MDQEGTNLHRFQAMPQYTMNSINASVRQLAMAYEEYKKHPCLINQSILMDCLDNFVGHFDCLEQLMDADIFNIRPDE